MSPARQSALKVRAPAARRCAFCLEKVISIVVGAVGRQEEESGALRFQHCGGLGAFVNGEIVEDDEILLAERCGKLGFDPDVEGNAVHCLVDDLGRGQAVAAQSGDEGLRVPVTEWCCRMQPVPAPRPARRRTIFVVMAVSSTKTRRCELHPGLPIPDPQAARLTHVGALALRGHQSSFYM